MELDITGLCTICVILRFWAVTRGETLTSGLVVPNITRGKREGCILFSLHIVLTRKADCGVDQGRVSVEEEYNFHDTPSRWPDELDLLIPTFQILVNLAKSKH